jgi:hypothetical protein
MILGRLVASGPAVLCGAKKRGGADKYSGNHGKKDDGEAVARGDVFGLDDDAFPHDGDGKVKRDAAYYEAGHTPDHRNTVIREQLDFLHVTPRM